MSTAPNAGVSLSSVDLPGDNQTYSEIYVYTNNNSYGTEWYAYETDPLNPPPIWITTLAVVGVNPKPVQPGPCFVKLRANVPVNFASNPIQVNVIGGRRMKVKVTY